MRKNHKGTLKCTDDMIIHFSGISEGYSLNCSGLEQIHGEHFGRGNEFPVSVKIGALSERLGFSKHKMFSLILHSMNRAS